MQKIASELIRVLEVCPACYSNSLQHIGAHCIICRACGYEAGSCDND